MENKNQSSRREFIQKTGVVAAGLSLAPGYLNALHYDAIPGSNETIRVGFIGLGNRGSQLLNLFMKQTDCEIAALCDIYDPYTTRNRDQVLPRYIEMMGGQIPKMGEKFPKQPTIYKDYRKLLDDKSIDAVVIATPDHWHALQTIHADPGRQRCLCRKTFDENNHGRSHDGERTGCK